MTKSFITKALIFLLICFILAVSLISKMLSPQPQTTAVQTIKQDLQPISTFEVPVPQKLNAKASTPTLVDNKNTQKNLQTSQPVLPTALTPVSQQVQQATVSKEVNAPTPAQEVIVKSTNSISSVPAITTENDKVCVIYGPLDIEEKSRMDVILSKYKQTNLAKIDKKTTYLIYWNLGSDKKDADKMFARLKENGGALSDPKFTLSKNENGDYVVNIVRVNTGKAVAEKLTNDLIARASKVNTGGQWLYKALPEGYFYTISDTNKLNPKVLQSINVLIEAPRDPC